jgi:hypothetical protein
VSFGAAKTVVLLVVVMALPPELVSAMAVAPVSVTAVFGEARTAGPLTVLTPLLLNTVKLVLELK